MTKPLNPIARRALAAQADDRLGLLAGEGHEPAFEEIVRRYRGPLVAFATTIVSFHRAEDVVQASLQRAHEVLASGEQVDSLRAWLFTIVRNRALNALRDDPAWSKLDHDLDGVAQPPAILEEREELERVIDAICALPEAQRQAIVMREIEGESHAEIAARLHTSPTSVRGLIFRARRTLRSSVGALVPLPLLRWLLGGSTAAAGGAAAGTGALMAGSAAKLAVAVSVATVSIGAGVALRDRGVEGQAQANGAEGRGPSAEAGSAGVEATGSGPGGASAEGAGGSGRSAQEGEGREEERERRREREEESRERVAEHAEEARDASEDEPDADADRAEDARDAAQEGAEEQQEAAEEAQEQAAEQAQEEQEAAAEATEQAAQQQEEAVEPQQDAAEAAEAAEDAGDD